MAKTMETASQEPAMSQVLNDIRDVIVNDGQPVTAPGDEVLELTEIVEEDVSSAQAQDVIASIDNAITGNAGIAVTASKEEPAANITAPISEHAPMQNETVAAPVSTNTTAMMSPQAASSTSAALRSLLDVAGEQTGLQFRSGHTLEDLVVEALKPELAAWLDKHLPGLVQEIVEREIQRLIPPTKKQP